MIFKKGRKSCDLSYKINNCINHTTLILINLHTLNLLILVSFLDFQQYHVNINCKSILVPF